MWNSSSNLRSLVPAATLAAILSLPLVVVTTLPSHASACQAWAGTPYVGQAGVSGEGGRSGCSSPTTVYVELKYHVPLSPDHQIDFRSGTFTNVTLVPSGSCALGTHEYYVDTSTGTGGKALSDPRRRANCG